MFRFIFICFILLSSLNLYSAGSGTTSLEFLKIPVGARATALGAAYTSFGENDSFSLYYNPALSFYVKNIDVSLLHTEYVENLRNENINAVFKINESYSVGVGIIYMYADDFIHTVAAENLQGFEKIGKFGYYDLMAVGNIGFVLSDFISAGINIKYIQEKIYIETGETVLFDIGLKIRKKLFNVLKIGAALNNMGSPIKFVDKKENVPLMLRFGISFVVSPLHLNSENDDFGLTVDVINEFEYGLKLGIGVEFWSFDIIALRAGYSLDFNSNSLSNFTLGLGVRYNMFEVGYTFAPFDYFSNTHRISVNMRF